MLEQMDVDTMTYGGGPCEPDVRGGGAVQLMEHEQMDIGHDEDGLQVLERMPNVVVEPAGRYNGMVEANDNHKLEDTAVHEMIEIGSKDDNQMVSDDTGGGGIIPHKGTIHHYFPNIKSEGMSALKTLGMEWNGGVGGSVSQKQLNKSNSLLRKSFGP